MVDMAKYHLAQLNIAHAVDDIESQTMAPFVALLDEINALAESSPGFVWRLKDEAGNATSIDVFGDPRIIVNMSVWENTEPLMSFVYKSAHTPVMARRRDWFDVMTDAYQVLWWIEEGTEPTQDDAKERLEHLRKHGASPFAFTFKSRFPAPAAA